MGNLIKKTGTKYFRLISATFAVALLAIMLLVGSVLFCASGVEASGNKTLWYLGLGDRVVDRSWQWEHRIGENYSGSGLTKPVTWIVVANDHYGEGSGVTLLAEELIGKFAFDNSTNRGEQQGVNSWGKSGTGSATYGLRPWLNSTGIHSDGVFYRAFSETFKNAVLNTTLPNKQGSDGSDYSTQDKLIIPSTTELGDVEHDWTNQIGSVYPYFQGSDNAKRVTRFGGGARTIGLALPSGDPPQACASSIAMTLSSTAMEHFTESAPL